MAPTPPMRPGDTIGLWGVPSSTLNWCETNYEVTFYIAEFWNTLTNLGMIIPSIYGMIICKRQGIEPAYTYSFLTLFFIGIGSWMFHMTLRYEMQLLDELPMLYGSSYVICCLYTARNSFFDDGGYILAIMLIIFNVITTIVYLLIKEPIFFQVMFAVIMTIGLIISIYNQYIDYSRMGAKLLLTVITTTAIAFVFWNIDNTYCSKLTYIREHVLRPNRVFRYLTPLTQFHGWWHLLCGYAFYLQVFACVQQRLSFLKVDHSADEKWFGLIKKIDVTDASVISKSDQYKD